MGHPSDETGTEESITDAIGTEEAATEETTSKEAPHYDLIVIGAGSTGENVADYARRGGLSVVIVESELVGGECSYWACMPSKALLRPPAALRAARAVPGALEDEDPADAAPAPRVDAEPVFQRRDAFTSEWNDEGQAQWLHGADLDLVRGHARLSGLREVTVTASDGQTQRITARYSVAVCTGSAPSLPPVEGLADVRPWTSRDATSAQHVPDSLAVIGGGVVGCEMAAAFTALGSEVTMLVRGERLLAGNEPFAGELLAEELRSAGVRIELGATATEASREDPDSPVRVGFETAEGDGEVSASEVLVATGRSPRTADIGLEYVDLGSGAWLPVDDSCRVVDVAGGWLYAAGDVNNRALLTHQGKYQARVCGSVIAARARGQRVDTASWTRFAATADHGAVPQVVFTDPEVASVGRTAEQAREEGLSVSLIDQDMAQIAGAALHGENYRGRARLVVDEQREVLVGATFVGPDVAELLHAATVAIVGEIPLARLWHAVPAYPTVSEVWLRLLEQRYAQTAPL